MKRNIRMLLISSTLVVGFLFLTFPQSVSAITVSGKACPFFAGQDFPVADATTGDSANYHGDQTDPTIMPPHVGVCMGSMVSISAEGIWGHPGLSGPDGIPGFYDDTHDEYVDLGGISRVIAPINTLIGVFLTDDPPDPGAAPASLTLGSDDMTAPELQQAFAIGSSLEYITVPEGATRLFLGHNDGYEWINNLGSLEVTVTTIVDIDIKPETLNLQSKGVFTAFIELPEGYGEEDVDISTVECEGAPAVKAMMANDNRLIVKFDRKDLVGVSPGDAVVFTVTGMFIDGTPFIGTDCVVVIDNTKPVITSVVRDGVTEGQPTIVAGPSPQGLQEGAHAYMDRPIDNDDTRNYHWEGIPAELVGADYVMTYNEDKRPVYDPEVYNVSYAVTLGQAAKLYIFVDDRYAPFTWLTDGSSGAVFVDTGLDIMLNEVGGREVLQDFNVYGAEVPAGTYILGPSCDGNGSRNFYSIAAAK